MTSVVLRSMREGVAAFARFIRRGWVSAATTSSEHVDDQGNEARNLRAGNHLTEAPFVFSMKYIQTVTGALNLTQTCLSMVLFKSLCSHAEESLSAVLFAFSFVYSIAGLYMLLNGVCNAPSSSETPGHPSALLVVQQLLYHCIGSVVFLVCGIYVLVRYFNASKALVASVVSLVSAVVHLASAIYVYRGDFRRFMDSF
ncbi:uncharacterized protein [Dermacentor albipictus]|uniref:uncharacterized protein n=1 Tax=Dermacentor albipictus TaxID=60249 RepID=UPI0038FC9A84